MTDQPNPYRQPDETKGMLVGEAKASTSKQRAWFWLEMGCVVPLALIGLAALGLVVWVLLNLDQLNSV